MIGQAGYDVIEIAAPVKGMNTEVSPYLLSRDSAAYIENMLPDPLGQLTVRCGTGLVSTLEHDVYEVVKTFLYTGGFGINHKLHYALRLVDDKEMSSVRLIDSKTVEIKTKNFQKYEIGTRVGFSLRGFVKGNIKDFVAGSVINDGETVLLFFDNVNIPDGSEIVSVAFSEAVILREDDLGVDVIKTGLSAATTPSYTMHRKMMYICNGVDRVMEYNGQEIRDYVDFVPVSGSQVYAPLHLQDTRLPTIFKPEDLDQWPDLIGSTLKIFGNTNENGYGEAITHTCTITDVVILQAFVGFIFDNQPVQKGFYPKEILISRYPPRFSKIFSFHDKIWGFGEGRNGIDWRRSDQAMVVYFQYGTGLDSWFNTKTINVPSLNLQGAHNMPDNLETMVVYGKHTLFFGRNGIQAWTGSVPLSDRNTPDFMWERTIDDGVVNGELVLQLPNDVVYVSNYGVKSLSTLNAAQQIQISGIGQIDNMIKKSVLAIGNNDITYRMCTSFVYKNGSFFALKIGRSKLYVASMVGETYSWRLFSLAFFDARSFYVNFNGELHMSIKGGIYRYQDGSDGRFKVFSDYDGKVPVYFSVVMPYMHSEGRLYYNRNVELDMDFHGDFRNNPDSHVKLSIYGDRRMTYASDIDYILPEKGDVLGVRKLEDTMWDRPYKMPVLRFKFVANTFRTVIDGHVASGPLSFRKIRLYGLIEKRKVVER